MFLHTVANRYFFFQAEDGIRDVAVTGVQTCALPISEVADPDAAVQALGPSPRRVFLALGRSDIGSFVQAPQHSYLVRSVEPVDPPLAAYVTGRGPFTETDDRGLLRAHAIEIVVAKNSGGAATYGKMAAARALGLAVILLRRPALPETLAVETVDDAVAWLDHASALPIERGV